jgi:hypothetical protein
MARASLLSLYGDCFGYMDKPGNLIYSVLAGGRERALLHRIVYLNPDLPNEGFAFRTPDVSRECASTNRLNCQATFV